MGWHKSKDRQAFFERRAARMAKVGLSLETQVEGILRAMKEAGIISDFEHHRHYSREDLRGKDFTAQRCVGDTIMRRSFGVTISHRSWNRSRVRYGDTPQFHFPIGTKPETIQKRIVGLFS